MLRWSRAVGIVLAIAAAPVHATIYTVTSTLDLPDADPSDGACATAPPTPVCTLRAAVMQANAHPGSDTIVLANTTYPLTRAGYDQTGALGDLDVTEQLFIQGSGATIDANGAVTADRAFEVVSGSLSLDRLTIRNGATPSYGGAIYANAPLSMNRCVIVDNAADLDGGGIYATADITVNSSLIADNVSHGYQGGGIALLGDGNQVLILQVSEVAGNQVLGAFGSGGGIALAAASGNIVDGSVHDNSSTEEGGGLSYVASFIGVSLVIDHSAFDHNSSGIGGNLYLDGNDQISTTTVSRGSASNGGGIYAMNATHSLTGVGISGNEAAGAGGGIATSNASLKILGGSIDHNIAGSYGGGIQAGGTGSIGATVIDASVHDNRSSNDGGGIWSAMPMTIRTSAVYKNRAARGGGVFTSAQLDFDASILDGNVAGSYGGGAYLDSGALGRFASATITGNASRANYPKAGTGAGIYIDPGALAGARTSVFAYNNNSPQTIAPVDCYGTLYISGFVFLSTNASCTVNLSNSGNHIGGTYPNTIDPMLGLLQPLYDPTLPASPLAHAKFGRAPLDGSTLINAGPVTCYASDASVLASDEIGQARSLGGNCDIGAVEYGAALDRIFANAFEG